jgi:hypothetical protein
LQAADLLAYEWHKELKRLNGPPTSRGARMSLSSLLEISHITQHFGREHLRMFFNKEYAELAKLMGKFNEVE